MPFLSQILCSSLLKSLWTVWRLYGTCSILTDCSASQPYVHRESLTCLVSCSCITCWQIVSQLCFFIFSSGSFLPSGQRGFTLFITLRMLEQSRGMFVSISSCKSVVHMWAGWYGTALDLLFFCSINMETIPRKRHGNWKSVYISICRLFSDRCRVSKEGVYRWLMGKGRIFPQIFKDTMVF